MKELLTNLTSKLQSENLKTWYKVTISEHGKSKHILVKSWTSMGAAKKVKKDNEGSILVRVELAVL